MHQLEDLPVSLKLIIPLHTLATLNSLTYVTHYFLGDRIYVFGGSMMETGQAVRNVEYYSISSGQWQEDFRFRKGADLDIIAKNLRY